MPTKTKHYWVFMVLIIIANIGIFSVVSKSLEKVVADRVFDSQMAKITK